MYAVLGLDIVQELLHPTSGIESLRGYVKI